MNQDKFINEQKKFDTKIGMNKEAQDEAIRVIKEDMVFRVDQLDRLYTTALNEMNANIESVKKMARERVEKKEEELQATIDRESKKLTVIVDEHIEELIHERE